VTVSAEPSSHCTAPFFGWIICRPWGLVSATVQRCGLKIFPRSPHTRPCHLEIQSGTGTLDLNPACIPLCLNGIINRASGGMNKSKKILTKRAFFTFQNFRFRGLQKWRFVRIFLVRKIENMQVPALAGADLGCRRRFLTFHQNNSHETALFRLFSRSQKMWPFVRICW